LGRLLSSAVVLIKTKIYCI